MADNSDIEKDVANLSVEGLRSRMRMIDHETRYFAGEASMLKREIDSFTAHTKQNKDKIAVNSRLPYLVANVIEVCSSLLMFINDRFLT